MEMTYNGTLMMPANYAVVNEEEMTYVDGGFALPNWLVGGAIDLGIATVFGGVGSFLNKAAKSQISAACKRQMTNAMRDKLIEKGMSFSFAGKLCSLVPALMTVVAAICSPGGWIAGKWDSSDSDPNNGWCNF